ncbi:MAG TPA: hypothetical protein VJ697_10070 [Nitrososphaeraceae archaeon]|nr:hypothetical protein [Nitrososphaeraceae archaeon]
MTYSIGYLKEIEVRYKKYYFISIFIIYLVLSITLITTTIQISLFKSYSNIIFYLTSYISFISTLGFLSILSFNFYRWFLKGKNNFTLLYGILFSLYCVTLILALIYLISGLTTHPSTIDYTSPRELRGGTFSINIIFQNNIALIYDIFFIISFLLGWLLTVYMLKQYSRRIGKYKFWILVSIPLFFYLIRYDGIILNYFNLDNLINLPVLGIIYPSIKDAIYTAFINSNIQTTGIFFGFSFVPVLLKLKNSLLQNYMIITIIGMMFLFASRDFHSIFLNSVPPNGTITISFMPIGAFMLFTGIISFLRLAARDKEFYRDLIIRIERDVSLLKNIIITEKEIEISNKIRPLIEYSQKWQREHEYRLMKNEEVIQIIHDVVSEFRKRKR